MMIKPISSIIQRLFFLLLLMLLVACKKNLDQAALPVHIILGETYYTQFVIRYEKNTHMTTNYRRGASIPVNTAVTLVSINNRVIKIEINSSNQPLTIKNIEKHTGDDTLAAFDKLFAKQKVNLSRFSRLERKQIKQGSVIKGMRKKAVTVAIGYPPMTETLSLESNKWVYWSHRYNRFNVNFRQGKVSSVVD